MRSTDDKDRANMHVSSLKCTMSIGAGKEETVEEPVMLPCMQNSKAVKEGDELLVFSERVGKPVETIEPKPAPPAKKRKNLGAAKRLHQPKKKAMKRS